MTIWRSCMAFSSDSTSFATRSACSRSSRPASSVRGRRFLGQESRETLAANAWIHAPLLFLAERRERLLELHECVRDVLGDDAVLTLFDCAGNGGHLGLIDRGHVLDHLFEVGELPG